MSSYLFSSESVTEGHPDKICDQVSDAVLDAALAKDKHSRVACETFCKTGFVVVGGEITTRAWIDIAGIARTVIKGIGYNESAMGFDWETCGVLTAIEPQSPDISQGVTEGEGLFKEQGAGDQGLMFGYACDDTPELMPAPITYAHALTRQLALVRKTGKSNIFRPDGKAQVSLEYVDGAPKRIDTIVVSTQHAPSATQKQIEEAVRELVIKKVIPKRLLDDRTKYYINPTGRFVIGGPFGDAGLTGRKIIVDTYGGMGRHGGGAFSGKDPSKVDRSACYYARYVAKNLVAAGVARRVEVQVAYAIGVAQPVSVHVETFGTGAVSDERIEKYVMEHFDMRPKAIIDELKLLRPIYLPTASYGHFGREDFSWEKTHRAKRIAADLLPSAKLSAPKPSMAAPKAPASSAPTAKATGAAPAAPKAKPAAKAAMNGKANKPTAAKASSNGMPNGASTPAAADGTKKTVKRPAAVAQPKA